MTIDMLLARLRENFPRYVFFTQTNVDHVNRTVETRITSSNGVSHAKTILLGSQFEFDHVAALNDLYDLIAMSLEYIETYAKVKVLENRLSTLEKRTGSTKSISEAQRVLGILADANSNQS